MSVPRQRTPSAHAVALASDIRIVRTPMLDVAYEDRGPRAGYPLLLAHGWPDSVRTWDGVLPSLHAAGYRTVAYHLRGFGPTRFRERSTLYSGQSAALGRDLLDLADALELDRFAAVGHDWGARAAYVAGVLAPERVSHIVGLSAEPEPSDPEQPRSALQLQGQWYQYFLALPQAKSMLKAQAREFAELLWRSWSPGWEFADEELAISAAAFDNPTWADVSLHAYRHRWGLSPGDPRYRSVEAAVAHSLSIDVPTLRIHGEADARQSVEPEPVRQLLFAGRHARVDLTAVGHFPQRQAPQRVAREILQWLRGPGSDGRPTPLALH